MGVVVLKGLTCGDPPLVIRSNSAAASFLTDALSVPGVFGRATGDAATEGVNPPAPADPGTLPPGEPVFLLSKLLKKLASTPSCEVAWAAAEAVVDVESNFFIEAGDPPATETCGEPRERRSSDLGTPDAELTRAPSTRTPGLAGKAWRRRRRIGR